MKRRAGLAILVLGLVLSAGCTASRDVSRRSPPTSSAPAAPSPLTAEAWVAAVLKDPEDSHLLSQGERLVAGREFALHEAFLGAAANHVSDVSGWVEWLARQVGRSADPNGVPAVVRDVAARECCLRWGYVAAVLEGLRSGLAEVGGRVTDEAALAQLAVLAGHRDPRVSGAARALLED